MLAHTEYLVLLGCLQVEPGNKHYIMSDAILKIASRLSNPFPILALFGFPVPPFLRDAMYLTVANNRYRYG